MTDPSFTRLPRYLAAWDDSSLGYATIMNTYGNLDAENRHLAMPSSMDFLPLEGGIEDRGTNLPLAAQKVRKMVDNIRWLVGMEALYAAQAIDLRMQKREIALGEVTGPAYRAFREAVPFLGEDRNQHLDMQHAYDFVMSGKLMEIIRETAQNEAG